MVFPAHLFGVDPAQSEAYSCWIFLRICEFVRPLNFLGMFVAKTSFRLACTTQAGGHVIWAINIFMIHLFNATARANGDFPDSLRRPMGKVPICNC